MLTCGSSRQIITPRIGVPLGGNARSRNYATHILDDLHVRALYLSDQNAAVCILSVELLGMWEHDARALREAVAADLALTSDAVMLAFTHTHSAPDTMRLFCATEKKATEDRDLLAPWMADLREKCIAAARAARQAARPARMILRQGENSELPFNRRLRLATGETVMNWTLPAPHTVAEVLGPTDPTVTLSEFRHAESGDLLAAAVHYALHPAILAGLNLGVSGDWPGHAMARLERDHPGATVLFLNGALGNINHIDYTHPAGRDAGEVERYAAAFAETVSALLAQSQPGPEESPAHPTPTIAFGARDLLFPIRVISEDRVAWARQVVADTAHLDLIAPDGVPPEMEARRTLRLQQVSEYGYCTGEFTTLRNGRVVVPIQVIAIGSLTLSAVPAEMFVEHGIALRQRSGNPFNLFVCPANGYIGYVPVQAAFSQGGYEPELGPSYLPEDAEHTILTTIMEMQATLERNHNDAKSGS